MRRARAAALTLCVAAYLVLGTASVRPTTLSPIQLKGLRGVNLVVFVDRNVDDYQKLEREVTQTAQEALARDGNLGTEGPDGVRLAISVLTYESKGHLQLEDALVLVRVELREQVRLKRNPSLKIPGGIEAVTWADQFVGVESKAAVRTAVLKDVDWLVGSFAANVKSINR